MVQVVPSNNTSTLRVTAGNNASNVSTMQPSTILEYARDWAIKTDGLVQGIDYSSKYYANKSHEYADSILQDSGFIAVSADLTNIDTVAGSISNVNAVATDISNVNAVAADLTNIDSVAGDLTNIDSVANDLTKINDVSDHLHYIENIVDNMASVNSVAWNIYDVETCSNYMSSINTCASNMNRLSACADNMEDILNVSDDMNKIRTIVPHLTNIDNVATNISNVNAVAGNETNINAVVGNATNINTCSTNITDINTCAANIGTISQKVSKTGDTMTGDLIIEKDVPSIICKSPSLDVSQTTTPSGDIYALSLRSADKNGNLVSQFGSFFNANNHFVNQMYINRKINGVNKIANFVTFVTSTGEDRADASTGVKQSITNWAFPSGIYDNLTLGASGTDYIAPADGWFTINKHGTTSGQICAFEVLDVGVTTIAQISGEMDCRCSIPVAKGQYVRLWWNAAGSLNFFRFVYATGG